MSNFSGTRYESGCESGWTLYFEESIDSENLFRREESGCGGGDLSMVSDASSGPPNGFEENEMSFQENFGSVRAGSASESAIGRKEKGIGEIGWKTKEKKNQYSYLDDTASSPVLGFSKKEMNSYAKEGFEKNDNSRKHPSKKQTGIFQSSSAKKSARKVSGDL